VLAAMGRHYDSAAYLDAIARLRDRVPHVNLTTDVIVGYPTEDEAAFDRTLDAVVAAGITRVHAFTFSPRPGTEADRLGDPVPPAEKKRRSRELRGLSDGGTRAWQYVEGADTVEYARTEGTPVRMVTQVRRRGEIVGRAETTLDSTGAPLTARLTVPSVPARLDLTFLSTAQATFAPDIWVSRKP